MNVELESINLTNIQGNIVKENKNIINKEDFQLILCQESNNINVEENRDNEDIIIEKNEEDEVNSDYEYYGYIISNQYLKEDKIIDRIGNGLDNVIKNLDREINHELYFVDNKLLKNTTTNEKIEYVNFEVAEYKDIIDTKKVEKLNLKNEEIDNLDKVINNLNKEINNLDKESNQETYLVNNKLLKNTTINEKIDYVNFEVSENLKLESKDREELNLNNMPNNKEIIEDIKEIDILGKISMIKTDRFFEKNISKDMKVLQHLSKNNMESKINDEAIKNIKFMKMEDIKELSIKLRPRELGDMHIKLLQENETLKAVITVSDKDVYSIMEKNLSELKQHIEMFNVKEISIVVESENNYSSDSFDKSFEGNKRNEHNSNNRNTKKNNTQLNIEESIICEKEEGINLLA